MPLAIIKIIEGVFSRDEKQQLIQNVSEAMIRVEGENLREKTVILLEEIKSGDWGFGGKSVATDAVKKLRAIRQQFHRGALNSTARA